MVFGRREDQDILDKIEEIVAFGGYDGKAVAEDGDFAVVEAVLVSVHRGKAAPFPHPSRMAKGQAMAKRARRSLFFPVFLRLSPSRL